MSSKQKNRLYRRALSLAFLSASAGLAALAAPPNQQALIAREKILINQARQCLKSGDAQQAIKYCNEALEFYPKSSSAYVKRAEAELLQQQFESALVDCDKALTIDKRGDAFYRKGCALAGLKRYKDALPLLSGTIDKHPDHAMPYMFRAGCLQNLKDYKGALSDYHSFEKYARGISENNGKSRAFKESMDCARALKRTDLEEIEIKNWLAVDPDSPAAVRAQAELLLHKGHKDGALAAYKKLSELDPGDKDALAQIKKLTK